MAKVMNQEEMTYDLVVGLGRSGVSMARFLRSIGRRVVATDIDPNRTDEAAALEALGVTVRIGSHDQDVFDRAARIIPSPGIPLTMPYIKKAVEKGVKIQGELDIFAAHNTTKVLAITGTNGKTTTTTLAAEMAQASGLSCFVCGNIGTPLVEYLMADQRKDLVVAEISSFQLDLAEEFKPDVGVLLNISEDHLDRYPDYRAYIASKWSLFARQAGNDTAVLNRNLPGTSIGKDKLASAVLEFASGAELTTGAWIDGQNIRIRTEGTQDTIPTAALKGLPGDHNRENIAAAALAVLAAGGTMAGIKDALASFTALPHRTAFVREIDGVRYYNDSKATNTDAVVRALAAFEAETILILGGREKHTDFTQLIDAVKPRVKLILAIGEASDNIIKTFETVCHVIPCSTMAQAITRAQDAGSPGDIVLLSPACASFDMYANYEARGDDFTTLVNNLGKGKEAAHVS